MISPPVHVVSAQFFTYRSHNLLVWYLNLN